MIHWTVGLLLFAAGYLIGYPRGRSVGHARGLEFGLWQGRQEGREQARWADWAGRVRAWAGED